MKKIISAFTLLLLTSGFLLGCGAPLSQEDALDSSAENITIATNNVVTAINALQEMKRGDFPFRGLELLSSTIGM